MFSPSISQTLPQDMSGDKCAFSWDCTSDILHQTTSLLGEVGTMSGGWAEGILQDHLAASSSAYSPSRSLDSYDSYSDNMSAGRSDSGSNSPCSEQAFGRVSEEMIMNIVDQNNQGYQVPMCHDAGPHLSASTSSSMPSQYQSCAAGQMQQVAGQAPQHLVNSSHSSHAHHLATKDSKGSSSKPRRKRIINVQQRHAANIRERKRMGSMNGAFEVLKQRLPAVKKNKRVSRIETLRLAMAYISYMSNLVHSSPANSYHMYM